MLDSTSKANLTVMVDTFGRTVISTTAILAKAVELAKENWSILTVTVTKAVSRTT